MNVAQLETEMLSRNLQTFVMMLPNIAMWGDVSMAGEGFALESLTEAVAGAVTGKLWCERRGSRSRRRRCRAECRVRFDRRNAAAPASWQARPDCGHCLDGIIALISASVPVRRCHQ